MKTKLIGLLVISMAVAGVLAYKFATHSKEQTAAAPAAANGTRVLLYADLSEADEDCGCGQIIRAVRDASAHGVVTRENDDELGRSFKVTTNPTVVILDGHGHEETRYVGESKATIAQLREHLAKLQGGAR